MSRSRSFIVGVMRWSGGRWAFGLLGTLAWLGACGSDGSSKSDAPTPPLVGEREACTGADGCEGTRSCTKEGCSACSCASPPTSEECMTDTGCPGTRSCEDGACDACVCREAEEAWVEGGSGQPVELVAEPGGTVLVRLSEPPWLVRYTADGDATPLDLQAGLPWAESLEVAPDGSLYVAGTTSSAAVDSAVRVQRLGSDGSLLGSGEWIADNEPTTFGALGVAPDGTAYAVVDTIYGRTLARLDEDGLGVDGFPLPEGSSGPLTSATLEYPRHLVFAADGSLVILGGAGHGPKPWLQKITGLPDAATEAWLVDFEELYPYGSVDAGGVAPLGADGWLVSVGTGLSGPLTTDYRRSVFKVGADGRTSWRAENSLDELSSFDERYLRARAAALGTSIVLAVSLPAPNSEAPNFLRFTSAGQPVQSWRLDGILVDVARQGSESALVLSAGQPDAPGEPGYTLRRFDFAELGAVSLSAAGEACQANDACESGRCCSAPGQSGAVCGAGGKCEQGAFCAADGECNGACRIGSARGAQGFCSAVCESSSDCPTDSFCVEGDCLPVCEGECPYRGSACESVANTEGIDVNVCSPE